jgi:hypothetical protein
MKAAIPGVGLAQRLFRLPALQPRPPHREFSAQYQDLYFSHRFRGARLVGHQAGMRSAQQYQAAWGPIRHIIGHNIAIYHNNPNGVVIEFFCDMDQIFDEELGFFEPRPWQQDRPQRPKVWSSNTPSNWWGPTRRSPTHGGPSPTKTSKEPS